MQKTDQVFNSLQQDTYLWKVHQEKRSSAAPVSTATDTTKKLPKWVPTDDWLGKCARGLERLEEVPFDVPWPRYALGDCMKMCYKCNTTHFAPNTIMGEYKRRACPKTNPNYVAMGNLSTVHEIFKLYNESQGFHKPNPETLILHLRLGDVIELSNTTVTDMLTKGGNPSHSPAYKNAIKSAYEYLRDIETSGLTKVEIVGGSHKKESRKSRVYAGCLQQVIRKAGYKVSMRLNADLPDNDFYYMSHARKIVVSAGGFSALIGQLVEYGGGKVVGRTFRNLTRAQTKAFKK